MFDREARPLRIELLSFSQTRIDPKRKSHQARHNLQSHYLQREQFLQRTPVVVPMSYCRFCKERESVQTGSNRPGQVGLSAHFRPPRGSELASRISLRMTAVIARFGAFPPSISCWYLRLRSALNRITTRVGMKIAARKLARPPRAGRVPADGAGNVGLGISIGSRHRIRAVRA